MQIYCYNSVKYFVGIKFHFYHFLPLVKVCFTLEHTFLASCAFALRT